MPATLTIARAAGTNGVVPDGSGFVKEELTVTGSTSVAGDTGTYICTMKQPLRAEGGPFSYSISGQTLTLTDEAGLGNAVAGASVYGIM